VCFAISMKVIRLLHLGQFTVRIGSAKRRRFTLECGVSTQLIGVAVIPAFVVSISSVYIVAYLLIARIVEPAETAVTRQPLCKHATVPEPSRRNLRKQRMEELLEAVFYMWSVPKLHKDSIWCCELKDRMDSGSNTSTVALRVVGDDEKGTQCLGGMTG
jgi:hypothetical protein